MTLVSELEETHQHWLDMHLKSGEFSLFNTLGFFQGEKKKLGGKSLSSNLTAAKPHLGSNHSLRSEELRFPTQGATALYSSFLLCFYSQPKHDCASCNGSRILFFILLGTTVTLPPMCPILFSHCTLVYLLSHPLWSTDFHYSLLFFSLFF